MKRKIKSILIIFVTILSISCNNSQSYKSSSVKAFEEFQLNVEAKDYLKAKRLLSGNENGVYEKYIDTIFNVLNKPTIEFIPEEKDGAYGIKKFGDTDLFYAYLKEDNNIFSTIGIMIRKNTNGYQIINITKVVTSKERNINYDENALLDKNNYEILGTNHYPTTENFCVLIKNISKNKDTLQKFVDSFRIEICKKQCNIDLIDDKSAYPLIYNYDLDGEDYLIVADHLVASSSFDYNSVQMYPLQDSHYKELGGNNWKKEPIQSEVITKNNQESATQKSVEASGWRIKEECLAAINESKFSELNKVSNRRDQNALKSMINAGYVKVLNINDKIEMMDYGFTKSKIKLNNGEEYYIANEFITHN